METQLETKGVSRITEKSSFDTLLGVSSNGLYTSCLRFPVEMIYK